MFIGSLFLLLTAPPKPRTSGETTFLTRMDKAVSRMDDRKTSFLQFEKTVTKTDALRCKQVLSHLKPNSIQYADCAFIQAYYGIDYKENVHNLMRPYLLWKKNANNWQNEYPNDADGVNLNDVAGICFALNWLYNKHHDLISLGAWEDLRLEGGWTEFAYSKLFWLWEKHNQDLLQAACNNPQRIRNLVDIVEQGYDTHDRRDHRAEIIADMQPCMNVSNEKVVSTAKQMIRYLQTTETSNR